MQALDKSLSELQKWLDRLGTTGSYLLIPNIAYLDIKWPLKHPPTVGFMALPQCLRVRSIGKEGHAEIRPHSQVFRFAESC